MDKLSEVIAIVLQGIFFVFSWKFPAPSTSDIEYHDIDLAQMVDGAIAQAEELYSDIGHGEPNIQHGNSGNPIFRNHASTVEHAIWHSYQMALTVGGNKEITIETGGGREHACVVIVRRQLNTNWWKAAIYWMYCTARVAHLVDYTQKNGLGSVNMTTRKNFFQVVMAWSDMSNRKEPPPME